jgi:hypothetical protein
MGQVERGVVRPANKPTTGGDDRNNGFLPLSGMSSPVSPPNQGPGGDRRGGSFPLGGASPAIRDTQHRFNVDEVLMPQPASAIEPGKGAIPVNPFMPGGAAARSASVADDAKARPGR